MYTKYQEEALAFQISSGEGRYLLLIPPVEVYAYIVPNTWHNPSVPLPPLVVVRMIHACTQIEYEYRVHIIQTAPARDFAEPGADFFAGPQKTFIARQTHSSVARPSRPSNFNPMERRGALQSHGVLGNFPALPPALRTNVQVQ